MKPHQAERRACQLGEDVGEWGIEEDSSPNVTFIRTWSPEVEGSAGEFLKPGGHTLAKNLSATAPEDLPHLRQPLIYLSLCARTANNQLKLADFSTFVREPAALVQLSICRKGSREPGEKKKKAFKSLFLFISLFSAPPPCSLHCHASSSSFFKNRFITIFSFMW